MQNSQTHPTDAAELRRQAEERLKGQRTENGGQRTELETARLVHELQVHQIELEMQNEELQQARARAETLLAQYTELYDFAPVGYLTLDREGTIRQLNLTGARLLGLERSRLVIRRFGQFVADGDRPPFSHFLERVFASEAKAGCEVTLPQAGYPTRFVQIDGTRSADGQECLAVVQDHTERRQAQETLCTLNAELEQRVVERTAQLEGANKELEAFSYSVAHDLRAPLRHISGFAGLLRSSAGPRLPDKSRHYLDEINEAATQMGRLIDDLLQFSRIGRTEMRQGRLELTGLVEESIQQLGPEINGRNILWQKNPLPAVQADPGLLRQVLINLFSNAIKYTRPRDPAKIEIGCASENGQETVIFVRDNGVGFDMEYSNKLFRVFQRLHADEEFEGTGVGLANVRRIIALHGGRTWAEGKVNEGATFYFSLPI